MNNETLIDYIKIFAFSALIVYVQNIVSHLFVLNDVWFPDISIIFIVFVGQTQGRRKAILVGFWIGLLQDLSSDIMGMFALSKTIAGLIAGFFPFDVHYNRTKYVYGLLSVSSAYCVIYYSLIFYGYQSFFNSLIKYMIPNMLYTIFVGIILYFLIEKWINVNYGARK